MTERQADVLVVGAGMAGLTAAARAARQGASVLVLEVAPEVGGAARFAGYAWTAPSREVVDEVVPDGDPELRHALVDRFADGVAWISSLGVHCHEAQPMLGFGRGHRFDTGHYIDACCRVVAERGEILTGVSTNALTVAGGAVTGAEATLPDGDRLTVHAGAVVLATGGFQADPELRATYVHPDANRMQLRSTPYSSGAGLRLAQDAGARITDPGAGFYGHLVPTGVPFAGPSDFVDLSLYYSEHALLFNLGNERFVDETLGDHLTTMALLEQPQSRGLLVADARVHREFVVTSYVKDAPATDRFAAAARRGGRAGVAEDLDDLALLPEEWGYDGPAIRDAVAAFNATAAAGDDLSPGRRHDAAPLDEPPYYVVEAEPAITFPFSGIRIDSAARVLDHDGAPVPGLHAAGADAGGLYVRAYAGGIAAALVFGLTAADSALTTRQGASG